MKIAIPLLIISFLLDGIVSNFISFNTNLFAPLFSLVALIIVYPYFNKNTNHYLITACLLGLAYDFVYTDTLILNLAIFFSFGLLMKYVNSIFNINIVNTLIWLVLVIALYRIVTYLILVLAGYFVFNSDILLKSIYSSLILNIGYCLIMYYIMDHLSYKLKIKKWD